MKKRKSHLTKRPSQSKIELMVKAHKIIFGSLAGLVIILILAVLNYFQIISLPFLPTNFTTQKLDPHALDTCALTKAGNPLVEELSVQAGVVSGSFKGNISQLDKDEVRQSIILKLKSLDLTQEYKFNIIDSPNLIVNTLTNKIASSSALKKDQLVRLEFVCNNETQLLEYIKLSLLSPQATQSGKAVDITY